MIALFCLTGIGLLFVVAAVRKLAVAPTFAMAVSSWPIVAPRYRRRVAAAIPCVELLVGLLCFGGVLVWPPLKAPALLLAALTLVGFALVQLVMTRDPHGAECGCFGASRKIDAFSVARASSLALVPLAGLLSLFW